MAQINHTDKTFGDVLCSLPHNVKLTETEVIDLRTDLDEVLALSDTDVDDELFAEFVQELDKKNREGTAGGRPPDRLTTTRILWLLSIYQRYVQNDREDWQEGASPRSNFPRFVTSALAPVLDDEDGGLTERIAKKWSDIRKKMKPF